MVQVWLLLLACRPEDAILVGSHYACLHHPTGTLECQSTDGDAVSGETSPPEGSLDGVAHSDSHLCGFNAEGAPVCWGAELSPDGLTEVPTEIQVESFFLGYSNTCVFDAVGEISCWGNSYTGLNEAPEGGFVRAAAAEQIACAQAGDATWSCWGNWWEAEVIDGGFTFDWTLPDEEMIELEGADGNLCGLDVAGGIHCWGIDTFGVTQPPDGVGFRDLSVGRNHACVLDANQAVRCWGDLESWRARPEGRWRTFDAGPWVDCGIREDGEVDCWGCLLTDPFTCDWDE